MTSPSKIDRYVVEHELGQGAFGTVYRARHAVTGRPVALKVLHARHATDHEMVARFFRESRAAASTRSPYIVDVLDAGVTDGTPFLALELLDGEDLEHHLADRDRPALLDAIEIAREVAAGVADAHARGIVHRDLKPANVFLARLPDGTRRAKVLDFGMSKLAEPLQSDGARTATGAILGTPLYMAPEQLDGGARRVEAAADVYALGALLFRMLTGRPTHDAHTIEELLVRKLTEPAPGVAELAPAVPASLVHLVARCLEPDPRRRTITAAEVAKELGEMARVQRGRPLSSPASAPPAEPPTRVVSGTRSRWPRVAAVLALSVLAVSCLVGGLFALSMGGLAWAFFDAAPTLLGDAEPRPEASAAAVAPEHPRSPASEPPQPAVEGSAPDTEGVLVSASVIGLSDGTTEQAIAHAARAAMGPCRGEREERFELQLMWMGLGAMGHGTSNLIPRGRAPRTPAELCAQAAILDASRGQSSSGIVQFRVLLPAR